LPRGIRNKNQSICVGYFGFLSHWTSIGNKNTKTITEVLFKTYIYIYTYWYYYTKKALLFDFILLN
jgi:hypothetical protein